MNWSRENRRAVSPGALPRFRLRQAYGAIPRPRDEADSEPVERRRTTGGARLPKDRIAFAERLALRHQIRANPLRVERTERLEGSRFVAWQLYGLVASGSRARLEVWQFYAPLWPPHGTEALGKTWRWVIPGSRLLLTDRAAIL